jgi:hypothetical protein
MQRRALLRAGAASALAGLTTATAGCTGLFDDDQPRHRVARRWAPDPDDVPAGGRPGLAFVDVQRLLADDRGLGDEQRERVRRTVEGAPTAFDDPDADPFGVDADDTDWQLYANRGGFLATDYDPDRASDRLREDFGYESRGTTDGYEVLVTPADDDRPAYALGDAHLCWQFVFADPDTQAAAVRAVVGAESGETDRFLAERDRLRYAMAHVDHHDHVCAFSYPGTLTLQRRGQSYLFTNEFDVDAGRVEFGEALVDAVHGTTVGSAHSRYTSVLVFEDEDAAADAPVDAAVDASSWDDASGEVSGRRVRFTGESDPRVPAFL